MTSRASNQQQEGMPQASAETPDVAVVGLGPVGITLCNLLAAQGFSIVGIDSAASVYDLPRAIGMDHEVMRVFQNIGIADALAPYVSDYRPSEYHAADGSLLRRMISPPEPYPLAWPPYLTFLQPDLERVLRESGMRYANLSLRMMTEMVALENPNAPILTLREKLTADVTVIKPRFVVGCDGGNSFVRRALDIEFEDLTFDEPWLVVDILLEDQDAALPPTNIQFCNPDRPHTYVVGPGRLRRWEFMVLPGEDPAALNRPEHIWDLLAPWLRPDQARLWRSAAYNFHALVASKWRRGNVFLAGDACHMTPPFLAQGMVQGVKDASNLAWKLAHVLNGGSDRFLESYETERRPLVREVIAITKDLGHEICELDPDKARIRNDRLLALMEAGQGIWIRQDLFPPIRSGILGRSQNGSLSPGAGKPCPQPWIVGASSRRRLDDVLRHGFNILTTADFPAPLELLEKATKLGIGIHPIASEGSNPALLREEHTVFLDWLRALDAGAVLVRPDHVVFGTADHPVQLQSLLDQWQTILMS
jgi:3-(3-hydroxy-phenyl)propionate hydroxylase